MMIAGMIAGLLVMALPQAASAQLTSPAPNETPLYFFGSHQGDGGRPVAPLIQGRDGLFYGTSIGARTSAGGTVFSVTSSGTLTTLHAFGGAGNGISPRAALVQGSDGLLYGTTDDGGRDGFGTVFRIATNGSGYTLLHSFTGTDGSSPHASLLQASDGNFYGTTLTGGPGGNAGTVFRLTPGGVLTTLHVFTGPDGANPSSPLIQTASGDLVGTAQSGGANNVGTAYRLSLSGGFSTFAEFGSAGSGGASGYTGPGFAGLVQASDGSFYGTTLGDLGSGTDFGNFGSVFRLSPGGLQTTLHTFTGHDGAYPGGGVVIGRDGNLYGATQQGGANGAGTLFRVSVADGTLTTLHDFRSDRRNPDGSQPNALVLATSGVYYGTTYASTLASRVGGVNPDSEIGTVFSLVVEAPSVVMSISPATVAANAEATLAWSSPGATACTASGSWRGAKSVSGSVAVSQARIGDYTYMLSCSNPAGSGTGDAVLHVAAPPAVSVTITPQVLTPGKTSATLVWQADRAASCVASGEWTGARPFNGTLTISPSGRGPHRYTLTCTGIGGSTAGSASVFQLAAPPR